MMKRALALILALVLCLGVLAGCQNDKPNETTAPDTTTKAPDGTTGVETTAPVENVLEFDGKEMDVWTTYDFGDGWLAKAVKAATGMTVTYNKYDATALTGMLTEKVTPSLVFHTNYTSAQTDGRKGAYINLAKYLDQMPNLKAAMEQEDHKDIAAKYWLTEDELYGAPIFTNGDLQRFVFMYRQDIMDELDLDYWTDFDSFYNVLKKMKEKYKDSYPFALRAMTGTSMATLQSLSVMWGDGHTFRTSISMSQNRETGKYYSGYTSDAMREMLTDIKKLMDEGLMDPASLTYNTDGWSQAMTTGRAFVTFDKAFQYDSLNNNLKSVNEKYQLNYGAPVVMREGGVAGSPAISNTYCWTISGRPADMDLTIAFLDWMYSEEGRIACSWGIEGETYELDEEGNPYFLETETFTVADRQQFARYQGAGDVVLVASAAGYSEECVKCMQLGLEYAIVPADPRLVWNTEEQADISLYDAAYATQGATNLQNFMSGKNDPTDNDQWNAHVKQMQDMNEAKLIELADKCFGDGRYT